MSLPLHVHGVTDWGSYSPCLGRITTRPVSLAENPADHVLLLDELPSPSPADLEHYAGILLSKPLSDTQAKRFAAADLPVVHSLRYTDHLADGDVVALHPNGFVRTLYRVGSEHNALFATDRCNSFCLMCSQPPRPVDDRDRITEHLRLIDLIDPLSCKELGITGGEPTLLKDDLLKIVERCRDRLPETALHILSNGRLFYYGAFARKLAEVGHPDLVIGVPLYSALDWEHDYIVQARSAFEQTLVGLHNLGRHRVAVEIRVVVHALTCRHLKELAEFVYRNLPFACHVTFMGLELMGFAVPNLAQLWVDPWLYRSELECAVLYLARRGMTVSIYNHPLCIVPRRLWYYCRRSISDWKNDYMEVCDGCAVRSECGGFFTSSLARRVSDHIYPIE